VGAAVGADVGAAVGDAVGLALGSSHECVSHHDSQQLSLQIENWILTAYPKIAQFRHNNGMSDQYVNHSCSCGCTASLFDVLCCV
jgi:hypothetical protein